jgi:serine/threonine protein kinase/dipeptidyl aminopeptidase/acylaminoacyl peptidase
VIGQTLSRYEVLDKVGEGGMGVVYKARDTLLGRLVALKTLPSGGTADPDRRERLLREARAASALHHPNIVDVYDLLHHEGTDVIVMELVTGRTLDRAVAGKPLRELIGYARQIADALAKAHAAGIVHRDLKPSNVMVDEGGAVRILDFGLARLGPPLGTVDLGNGSGPPAAEATAERHIVGTLAYMSPEQAEGKKADARSDVFSFGAVLYEMVTGRMAFRGDSAAATLAAVLEHDPPPPRELVPGLPLDLEKLVQRCLRKDPAKRFQSMGDVALDLEEVAASLDTGRARPRRTRRGRWAVWLVACVALLALAGLVAWRLARGPGGPPEPPQLVQLTSYVGRELSPTFSPDGSQVAFAWNGEKEDNFDIYVRQVGASGPPLRLTTDPASDTFPAWSPDGRQIAFRRMPGPGADGWKYYASSLVPAGAVMVMPALGGPQRKVADVPRSRCPTLSWTPDGRWLATPAADSSGVRGIFLFPLEQGEPRRLTSSPSSGDLCPALSPDGRFLAYSACTSEYTCTIQVLQLQRDLQAQGPPRRVVEVAVGAAFEGLAWAADGRSLVYSVHHLYRVPLRGAPEGERIELAGTAAVYPAISRALDRLAFTRGTNDRDVWKLEEGRPPTPFIASSRTDQSPEFSPDGTRVAYQSGRWSPTGEIFVARADGSNPVQLTDGLGRQQGSPQWSPDGRRIAFDSQRQDGTFDVFVIDAAGGPPRRLTPDASNEHRPSWSRDGRWVYFASDRTGTFEVWRVPAEGGDAVAVTTDGGYRCVESVDGRTLYYVKQRVPNQPLFERPLHGGPERRILDEILGWTFAVADDGLYYFARTGVAGVTSLRFLDVTRGRSREVARLDMAVAPGAGLTVSPDRKTILFTAFKPNDADLFLIENFR